MANEKIIAVVGATGAQGGGLARAILSDPEGGWKVRALTRDVHSDKAMELARMGAEVVAADLSDEGSLTRAFHGAYGAFCVTFFWDHMSPETELAHAANMARAANTTGLKHVIWSTLEDTRNWIALDDPSMPTLMERYKVPHFDAKGEANELFADLGLPFTNLLTSFYWDNLIHFGMGPRRGEDGRLVFALPMEDKPLPGIAAEDIGQCAYGIFKKGAQYIRTTVGIAGEHLTGEEMAAALTRVLGEEVVYEAIPHDVYRGLDFPGAEDMGNMFQFKCDFNGVFCGARDLAESRMLNPELQTFEGWLIRHKGQIPVS